MHNCHSLVLLLLLTLTPLFIGQCITVRPLLENKISILISLNLTRFIYWLWLYWSIMSSFLYGMFCLSFSSFETFKWPLTSKVIEQIKHHSHSSSVKLRKMLWHAAHARLCWWLSEDFTPGTFTCCVMTETGLNWLDKVIVLELVSLCLFCLFLMLLEPLSLLRLDY